MRVADLEVEIPDAWEDRSLYTYVSPPADVSPQRSIKQTDFRTDVVFQKRQLADEETLDSCVKQAVQNTSRNFGKVSIEVESGPTTDTLQSQRLVYTHR